MTEDARLAAVVDEQRREQADERRLPRPVLAENRHALAARHRERDALDRGPALAREEARLPVSADEVLAEIADLDGRRLAEGGRIERSGCCDGRHAPAP